MPDDAGDVRRRVIAGPSSVMMKRCRDCAATQVSYSVGRRGRELHLDAEAMRLEQQVGQQRRRSQRFRQLDEDAERETVVNDGLADVENAHVVAREDRGERVR